MFTVTLILALSAFVVTLAAGANKAPLWVAVLLLAVALLVQSFPLH